MTKNLSDIKEEYVLDFLLRKNKHAEIYKAYDPDGKEIAQTFVIDNFYRSRPDIDVYDGKDRKEIIIRVEVKGFTDMPRVEGRKILGIKEKQFYSYIEFGQLTETEIFIVFVVGDSEDNFEFYWESVSNLYSLKKYQSAYKGSRDSKEHKYVFWNPKSLKFGLNGFCE